MNTRKFDVIGSFLICLYAAIRSGVDILFAKQLTLYHVIPALVIVLASYGIYLLVRDANGNSQSERQDKKQEM